MTAFPEALGLAPEQVEALLLTVGQAPSLHNAQPWRLRLGPEAIELYADPDRRLPAADPDDRELRIGCGAALYNLRLALLGNGIRPLVTILPDLGRPELLAVVRHGGRKPATPEQLRLLHAVPLRRTNRHPYADEPVDRPEQSALRRAALDEGAWLEIVDDPGRRTALRDIAARAHRAQMADPAFRAEFARWTGRAGDRADGVPAAAGTPAEPQDRWVLRDYTGGNRPARAPGKDFENEPLIAVLTTHLSGPTADVQAGQALQRVLLTATADGLAASFLSHVVEVPQAREEVRRLVAGAQPPQAVLRIGHGWPVPPTGRRAPADLIAPSTSTPVRLPHGERTPMT
ncbi:nitroreductase family protein [Pseudonocardia hierapolitana]|uniref:Nitroreductase family protein n=1 Tax=Pseudonocardia hierapolitana TaxID=1128676 RepID=A0A561SJS8_9PSEU|nr:nitroreductase [Pseudonocardia hierapolitana]TWF75147.1 nitroreductase family protein [Pseudonocardia hierapolitana]